MRTTQKIAYAFAGMALCSMSLWGCSGDQGKKEEKKTVTAQEQVGKDAAQAVQKPLEEARKAAQTETEAAQALKDTARDTQPAAQNSGGKEKRKLEGC